MPKSCSVGDCTNHHLQQDKKLSFYKFPDHEKDPERRNRWIWACGRKNPDGSEWRPTAKYLYVCNEHFVTGKPNLDPTHPDYVPSIFKRTPKSMAKGEQKLNRYSSVKKRRLPLEEMSNIPPSKYAKTEDENNDPLDISGIDNFIEDDVMPSTSSAPDCDKNVDKDGGESGFNRPVNASEREMMHEELNNLRSERDSLKGEVENLQEKLRISKLSADMVRENDDKCKFYTGLCWSVFEATFNFLKQYMPLAKPGSLPAIDQFFMTLVKLRQNPNFEYLADQLAIAKTTVIDIFWRWLNLMESKLSFCLQWPERETIRKMVPPLFKEKFPKLTNIIDCFEIFIERPKNLKARAKCYSNYKKHTTVKFLIGCSPMGAVIFLSRAWGGRVSDVELTRKSGYISQNLHHPYDQILADRGFTVQEQLASECGAELILPSFTKGKKQLTARQVETSRALASIRIHVERVIGLLKSRFAILQGTLPLSFVNSAKSESVEDEFTSVDKLVRVCAMLANLGLGIVHK